MVGYILQRLSGMIAVMLLVVTIVFVIVRVTPGDPAAVMLGPEATLWLGDPCAVDRAEWPRAYMNSFGMTIGGGTSEILRNVIGERILGLPKTR